MNNPKNDTANMITLASGEQIAVPDSDYRDVAEEVCAFTLYELGLFQDKLREFLEAREAAAPASVFHARVLDSVISNEAEQWLRACTQKNR